MDFRATTHLEGTTWLLGKSPESPPLQQVTEVPLLSFLQVVGSQARILYSDQKGRVAIAVAFNHAIAHGQIKVGGLCRLLCQHHIARDPSFASVSHWGP